MTQTEPLFKVDEATSLIFKAFEPQQYAKLEDAFQKDPNISSLALKFQDEYTHASLSQRLYAYGLVKENDPRLTENIKIFDRYHNDFSEIIWPDHIPDQKKLKDNIVSFLKEYTTEDQDLNKKIRGSLFHITKDDTPLDAKSLKVVAVVLEDIYLKNPNPNDMDIRIALSLMQSSHTLSEHLKEESIKLRTSQKNHSIDSK